MLHFSENIDETNLGSTNARCCIESRYLLTYFPRRKLCCIVRWFGEDMNKTAFSKEYEGKVENITTGA